MDAALDFSALIEQKLADYFQGSRQWALDDLETWRTAAAGGSITLSSGETVEAGPMFWLKGGPGTGKTVWSAKVCELHQKDGVVAAHHFCRHSDAQTSDPRRMLRSIAAQLAHSVPGYAAGACDSDALEDLFQALIAEPLRQVPTPAAAAHRVILIDALDECEAGGKNALLDLVATKFGQAGVLPPWLRLVVTSRPDGDIVRKLARFRPVSMECDKNADDARAYLAHLLKHRVAEADVTAAVDLLLEKSEALFLYLDFVRARLAMVRPDTPATLDELDAFPAGLDGIYASEFRRVFGDGAGSAWHTARPLLETLVAAREPPHADVLRAALGWTDDAIADRELATVSLLFPVRDDGRVHPLHKSVFDWLTDTQRAGEFAIDAAPGHATLHRACAAGRESAARAVDAAPPVGTAARRARRIRPPSAMRGAPRLVRAGARRRPRARSPGFGADASLAPRATCATSRPRRRRARVQLPAELRRVVSASPQDSRRFNRTRAANGGTIANRAADAYARFASLCAARPRRGRGRRCQWRPICRQPSRPLCTPATPAALAPPGAWPVARVAQQAPRAERDAAGHERSWGKCQPVAFSATARASRRGRRWARGRLGCVERRAGAGDGGRP